MNLSAWLSGDAPGWVGVVVSILSLGGGGAVGGSAVAIRRARLEDRRAILDALEQSASGVTSWSTPEMARLASLAQRLPLVDRLVLARFCRDLVGAMAAQRDLLVQQYVAKYFAHARQRAVVTDEGLKNARIKREELRKLTYDGWEQIADQRLWTIEYLRQRINRRISQVPSHLYKRLSVRADWLRRKIHDGYLRQVWTIMRAASENSIGQQVAIDAKADFDPTRMMSWPRSTA